MSRTIPVPSEPLLTRSGQINPIWWRYLRSIESQGDSSGVQEQIREILRRLAEIPEAREVIGRMSVVVIDQPDGTRSVQLEGDSLTPGSNAFYCTDPIGRRQWAALSQMIGASDGVVLTDSGYTVMGAVDSTDDLPALGNAGEAWWVGNVLYAWSDTDSEWQPDYSPSGLLELTLSEITPEAGGTLQKTAFDAKGRRTHEAAATTDDLPEGAANLYFTDERADARIELQKGQPLGLATLDANSKLDAGQLPALAITETFVVNTEAAMLALDCQQGDVAVRSDEQKSYILTAEPASTLANWQELLVPTGAGVASFNGRTGSVVPASGDYTPAQVGAEPAISSGTTSQYWRGDKSWQTLNKAAVGLANADNTSDANKPLSNAELAALANAGLNTTTPTVASLDAMSGGTARFFAAAAGAPGLPSEVSGNGGVGWIIPYNGGIYVQYWSTAMAGANRFFSRVYRAGAWAAWKEIVPFDTGWTDATLLNSWVAYGGAYATPGYRKVGSQVFLRGLMKDGTTASGTDLFQLPAGYRPAYSAVYTTPNTNLPTANVRIRIDTAGTVDFLEVMDAAAVSVDGITFFVD